jgi:hypothetical protein
VKLGAAASVLVFDPTVASTPLVNLGQTNSVSLVLSNHPVVVEISR